MSESDILAEVIGVHESDLSPEAARALLEWKFTDRAVARINSLAERNRKGTINETEREEFQRYLSVGGLINLLQAKARLSLRQRGESPT